MTSKVIRLIICINHIRGDEPMTVPQPFEIYKHFKGNFYQIIAVAQHTETEEMQVVYQALYYPFKIYVRPLDMFTSLVDREKYPQAEQLYRFEKENMEGAIALKPEYVASKSIEIVSKIATEEELTDVELANAELTDTEVSDFDAEEMMEPLVIQFLDSDTYEEKLNILAALRSRITDDMISTLAVAMDIEINGETTEERFTQLRNCLITLAKYECSRLR